MYVCVVICACVYVCWRDEEPSRRGEASDDWNFLILHRECLTATCGREIVARSVGSYLTSQSTEDGRRWEDSVVVSTAGQSYAYMYVYVF